MYKHIIWDFDGTLFDTYPVMGSIFKKMLEEKGINEPLDEILKHMKISMTYALKHYEEKYHINGIFIEEYKRRRRETEVNVCKPYPGMDELCKHIHSSGKRNYLYTHRGESSIKLLEKFGLSDCFSEIITSQSAGFARKPSPDSIYHLIDKHKINHSEAIMIGDRDLDILSAKNAGIHSCFFTEGEDKIDFANFNVNHPQQLYSIL